MKDPDVIPGRGNDDSIGSTSSGLIERARTRTPDSWERLTDLYGPLVYGWARRSGLRAEDAADVMQEVFLAVSRNLAGFRHGPSDTFRGWLWTIMQAAVGDDQGQRASHWDRDDRSGGADRTAVVLQGAGFDGIESEEGEKVKADVMISGEGISTFAARRGGLMTVKARLEIKAVERATDKVLAVDRQTVVVVDLSEPLAGKAALQEAAADIAERLLPKLLTGTKEEKNR